jgi:hypothetical protein
MRTQSAGQTVPSASGRHRHRFENHSSGEPHGIKDPFEDIRHWRASSATGPLSNTECFSHFGMGVNASADAMFSNAREPMAPTHSEFMFSPDSPIFNPGDLLTQPAIGGSFSTSFGPSEPPLMEFSASSGAATGSLHEFPGSDRSLSGEAPSPHFFQAETSSEGDVPYLDMYTIGQEPWSPSTVSVDMSLPSTATSGPMLPPGLMGSPTGFSPADEFASNFSNEDSLLTQFTLGASAFGSNSYDCVDLRRFVPISSSSGSFLNPSSSHLQMGDDYPPGPQFPVGSFGATYELPPRTKAFYSNRLSSDGESIKARQHELYNVGPGADGFYHCPFANEGCRRKPDKLKCNYE